MTRIGPAVLVLDGEVVIKPDTSGVILTKWDEALAREKTLAGTATQDDNVILSPKNDSNWVDDPVAVFSQQGAGFLAYQQEPTMDGDYTGYYIGELARRGFRQVSEDQEPKRDPELSRIRAQRVINPLEIQAGGEVHQEYLVFGGWSKSAQVNTNHYEFSGQAGPLVQYTKFDEKLGGQVISQIFAGPIDQITEQFNQKWLSWIAEQGESEFISFLQENKFLTNAADPELALEQWRTYTHAKSDVTFEKSKKPHRRSEISEYRLGVSQAELYAVFTHSMHEGEPTLSSTLSLSAYNMAQLFVCKPSENSLTNTILHVVS